MIVINDSRSGMGMRLRRSLLAVYADGLERLGYRQSPLEVMAYNAEATFRQSVPPFNAENLVAEQLRYLTT